MAVTEKPLLAAAKGLTPSRYPVWFMRQAGRYLSEYREIRANMEFTDLCKNPKLAAEVTLQPLRRFDLDGAIIFSDILVPPMVMGQTLTFGKGHGPRLQPPVRSGADVAALRRPDAEKELGFVGDAIVQTVKGLGPQQTMIGFAGAPLTVASYMVEGEGSRVYTNLKKMMFHEPQALHDLLALLAEVSIDYLKMQVAAGAEIVMLFDTWAAELTSEDYREFAFAPLNRVSSALRDHGVPVIYFPGKGSDRMRDLAGLSADVVSVHWCTRISDAVAILKSMGLDVSVQGNIDPQVFLASESTIRERTRRIVDEVRACAPRGHIFNVGHGLLPHTPPNALQWVIEELRALNR